MNSTENAPLSDDANVNAQELGSLTGETIPASEAVLQGNGVPECFVFDLDGCLWDPEMYQLWGGGPPFEKLESGDLRDCKGTTVKLIGVVREVLHELCTDALWESIPVGVASTTDEPRWARQCLQQFSIGYDPRDNTREIALKECFHPSLLEIHKGMKSNHLKTIQSETGVLFEQIVFFDNEWGNCKTVSKLNVNVVYCPDGIQDMESWKKVLEEYPFPGKILEI